MSDYHYIWSCVCLIFLFGSLSLIFIDILLRGSRNLQIQFSAMKIENSSTKKTLGLADSLVMLALQASVLLLVLLLFWLLLSLVLVMLAR